MTEQQRLLLAVVLSGLIMVIYFWWSAQTAPERPTPQQVPNAAVEAVIANLSREQALNDPGRRSVPIETGALRGSINLTGARIDDLELLRYAQTVEDDSPPVVLLQPATSRYGYTAGQSWTRQGTSDDNAAPAPGATAQWQLSQESPTTLTVDDDIILSYTADDVLYRRTISVDDDYLFTITDEAINNAAAPVLLEHASTIVQNRPPAGVPLDGFGVMFEGPIGVFDGEVYQRKYKNLAADQRNGQKRGRDHAISREGFDGDWLGFTEKYWLTALIAPRIAGTGATDVNASFLVESPNAASTSRYISQVELDAVIVAPGETLTITSHVYAGAKDVALLRDYQNEYGITKFKWAVDWGNMAGVLTQPFFDVLHTFGSWTGSYGLAILMLTIVVKAIFFPLANASYKSMAKVKKLQPKMEKIRKRYENDRQGLQQAMMELYRKEKVNPLAGCLPLIPQMFVFFALYKTLIISLEMRHEPFIGWIKDLSARDPSNMWNLFGLLPYDPAMIPFLGGLVGGEGFLALGAWAIIMGISMWAMQTLNPPPTDAMQAKIFAFMPLIFTFFLANFAVGLVIYWTWNNTLSFIQQYIIIRRQGVDTPIGTFLAKNYARIKAGELTPTTIKNTVTARVAAITSGLSKGLASGARYIKNRLPGAKS